MSREEAEAEVRRWQMDNLMWELEPLVPYLECKSITNVYIYGDGRLQVEDFEKGIYEPGVNVDESRRMRIINSLATMSGTPIDTWVRPTLEGIIPRYNIRTTAIIPPWTDKPEITFRRPAEKIHKLEEYLEQRRMTPEQYKQVVGYIKERKNIVLSGSTGSGKTTFTNAIIAKITEYSPEDRIYIVEDTPELQCASKNKTQLYIRKEQAVVAIQTALRWTPKRIIFGELRSGDVAVELLEAWNTGHPGNVTTIHADSAESTISRIEGLLRQKIAGRLPEIADVINVVVHLTYKHNFGPVVDEVREVREIMQKRTQGGGGGIFFGRRKEDRRQ